MLNLSRPLRIASLLSVALTAAACTVERGDVRTPGGEPPEADTVKVRKVMEAVALAFETGDLSSFDTLYDDSVVVFEGGAANRGWARYRDDHLVPELEALSDRRLVFEDIRVRRAGGTAWATFRFTLEAVHEGERVSASGIGTMVLQRSAGRWRVIHSHTSTPRPERDERERGDAGR